jgi:hypothetical protein
LKSSALEHEDAMPAHQHNRYVPPAAEALTELSTNEPLVETDNLVPTLVSLGTIDFMPQVPSMSI